MRPKTRTFCGLWKMTTLTHPGDNSLTIEAMTNKGNEKARICLPLWESKELIAALLKGHRDLAQRHRDTADWCERMAAQAIEPPKESVP